MIYKPIYSIFLDGFFIGITDDEYKCWEIAEQHTQGTNKQLYDDDVDRVNYYKIDINRYYIIDGEYNVSDKLSDDNIMCYDFIETEKCVTQLNKMNLKTERLEAKIRAMAL